MKVLVTGSNGQLGYDCIKELNKRGYRDVVAADIDVFDITDKDAVFKFIKKEKPEVIMHNAAYTLVDKAEKDSDVAYRVNALGTKNIAEAAEEIGAKMVYISTDYVFPGYGDSFYETFDNPKPLNVYGSSKLAGENFAKLCSKLFIVRVSWVFGVNGNNFINSMLRLSEFNDEIDVVCDQIGSPTYTVDLSSLLCDMIETEKYGLYHATNEGVCSWAEFANEIFKQAHKKTKVLPIKSDDYYINKPYSAVRPLNSRLSKKSLDNAGFVRLPRWEDALRRYLMEKCII